MISSVMRHVSVLFTFFLIGSSWTSAQTGKPAGPVGLDVRNGGAAARVTAADLSKLPRVSIDTMDGGRAVRFEGVRVSDVLAHAGVTFGQTLRGHRLATYLLARAADGYQVVFALPEIDPDFASREIIVADRQDGGALQGRDGPLRIIAAGDRRHARWVRGLSVLEIRSADGQ